MQTRWYLRPVVGYLGTMAAVGLATSLMWMLRQDLLEGAVALLYLLILFSSSLIWGMGPALAGTIVASLTYDYYFTPPILALSGLKTPSQAVMYVVFLTVAIVTSRLATRASLQAQEARLRARESRILYDLSRAIAEARSVDEGLAVTAERVIASFGVGHCSILLPDAQGTLRIQVCRPQGQPQDLEPGETAAAAHAARDNTVTSSGPTLYLPVQFAVHRMGVLRIGPHSDGRPLPAGEYRLLQTFAAAAAAAIDRRQLQDAVTQTEILQQSDQLKSALMGSVSHDLRTPLATIKTGITALLQRDLTWDHDTQRELLVAANDEVDRLTRLISNLLDVSRIEAGALRPDRQWYEIGELIREAVRRIDGRLSDRAITVEVPDDLPLVFVDYVQIQQVITNLIENAAKYAPKGTSIHVDAAVLGSDLVMRVRDHGPGIPATEAERIFSKFYRIGRQHGGTGLGLAICRGLVEAHGGRIWLENPGQPGAVLTVALPLVTPPTLVESEA